MQGERHGFPVLLDVISQRKQVLRNSYLHAGALNVVGREVASVGYGPEVPIASRQIQVQDNPRACTPASIVLSSPPYQSAVVQQPFPSPVAARVLDAQGRPVAGITVMFDRVGEYSSTDTPPAPDAAFAQSQVVTDGNGVVTTTAIADANPGAAQYRASFVRGTQIYAAHFVLANRSTSSDEQAIPVIEFYNTTLQHYFITASEAEQRDLDSGVHSDWVRTGYVFLVPTAQSDTTPVCRLYGLPAAGLDSHFYSGSPAECDAVLQRWPNNWVLETREAFRSYLPDLVTGVCATNRIPVYRLYNGQADANHRYTTSTSVKGLMQGSGWIPEGYGPNAVALCAPLS